MPVTLGGVPNDPGSGSLQIPLVLSPAIPTGTAIKAQAFVADAANAWGYSATNGLSFLPQ